MPEGPEVRRYADFLSTKIRGKRLSCVEIVDKASFSLWLIVGTWYRFLLLGTWYWYLVLGPWWYLTSATITVSVSSSKLLFPLPELFRKLVMRSQFQSQALKSAKLWYMLIFNLPVYDVKQEDHKAEQSQHSIGINGIPGSRLLYDQMQLRSGGSYPGTALVLIARPPSRSCLLHCISGRLFVK